MYGFGYWCWGVVGQVQYQVGGVFDCDVWQCWIDVVFEVMVGIGVQVQFVVMFYDCSGCKVCCFQEYGSGCVGDMGVEVVYQVSQVDCMIGVSDYQEVVVQCSIVVVQQFQVFVCV